MTQWTTSGGPARIRCEYRYKGQQASLEYRDGLVCGAPAPLLRFRHARPALFLPRQRTDLQARAKPTGHAWPPRKGA